MKHRYAPGPTSFNSPWRALAWILVTVLSAPVALLEAAQVPLASLQPASFSQSWSTPQKDRSVAGKPLKIGDRKFATGLGTHATSTVVYDLNDADQIVERFEAWVGVDAAVAGNPGGTVVFSVVADGRELFNSGVMRLDTPAKRVSVPLAGAQELKLAVTDAGDGVNADHADWAEAVLIGKAKPAVAIPPTPPAKFRVRASGVEIELSDSGDIVSATVGAAKLRRALRGETALAGCTNAGAVVSRKLRGGAVEFARQVAHEASGRRAQVTERFAPTKDSVRWEIEIRGDGAPWSTGIETRLHWPATNTTRFWTAWEDPEQQRAVWHDPLEMRPLRNARLCYGAPRWEEEETLPRFPLTRGDAFVIPLLTLAEPERDAALTLALSPEDTLLDLALTVRADGRFVFNRQSHRLSATNVVRFAMDLVGHAADWRGGLAWMTRRYPAFFRPPNPRVHEIAGLGAYSDWEGALDVAALRRMGFRVNWKASYDFPYMGLFLPPIADDAKYPRLVKGNQTSIAQLRDYSRRMKADGFHVLNYFNVTEFGATTGMPKEADPALAPADAWRNVHNFMRDEVGDGVLLDLAGRRYPSWEGCVGMDCGAPKYRAFLLGQARRHIEKLPDSDGICIDRMDWLRAHNLRADDGVSWRREQPSRALYESWRRLLAEFGPLWHAADKVILVNAMVNRTELLRHVDGIYHEFGHQPPDLNGAALQCVFKPCIAWTPDENTLKPDPDAFFQRQLYLGVYPTAPLPHNDHTICAGTWADQVYLDYGPLFDTLRGRQWVLAPHAVEVEGRRAKANVFQMPGGYLVAVTFGGNAESVSVRLRNLSGLGKVKCEARHPGSDAAVAVPAKFKKGALELNVPLKRGCAMVRISAGGR